MSTALASVTNAACRAVVLAPSVFLVTALVALAGLTVTARAQASPSPAENAANCPAAVTDGIDVYRESTCPGYRTCAVDLCTCLGSPASGDGTATAEQCARRAPPGLSCAHLATCVRRHVECMHRLATTARGDPGSPCYSWAATSYVEMLRTVAGTYAGSAVEQSCRRVACGIANATGRTDLTAAGGCTMAAIPDAADPTPAAYSSVCVHRAPERRRLAWGLLRMEGAFWANVTAANRSLPLAVAQDVAAAVGVDEHFVQVTATRTDAGGGSTSFDFSVLEGTRGASAAGIMAAAARTYRQPAETWLTELARSTVASRGAHPMRVAQFATTDGTTVAPPRKDIWLRVAGNWPQWQRLLGHGAAEAAKREELGVAGAADVAELLGLPSAQVTAAAPPAPCGLVMRVSVSAAASVTDDAAAATLHSFIGTMLNRTAAVHDAVFAGAPGRTGPLYEVRVEAVGVSPALLGPSASPFPASATACLPGTAQTPPAAAGWTTPAPNTNRVMLDPGYLRGETDAPSGAAGLVASVRRTIGYAASTYPLMAFSPL